MTAIWATIALATAGCFAAKFAGYVVSGAAQERPRLAQIVLLAPVALLSALAAVQTVVVGQSIVLDARLPAVAIAVISLLLRAPFLVVVVAAAATAALLRATGLAA